MKKQILNEQINRIKEINKSINEDNFNRNNSVFNDAGEPNMTHSQARDYTEPAEPDYDNGNNYDRPQSKDDIIKSIENHFNTILETYDGVEYSFLTKNLNSDLMLWIDGNTIGAIDAIDKKFEDRDIEEFDINELIQFFEPYQQYMLTGDEANKEMDNISQQNATDRVYGNQERGMMGGQ